MILKRKMVFGLIIVAIVVGTAYVAVKLVSHRRTAAARARGYQQIQVGDSKDLVVKWMGKPTRITECVYPWFSDQKSEADYRAKCKELYRYEEEFPVDYTLSFDKDGKVINKTTAVSD